jgi:hypothetical protein
MSEELDFLDAVAKFGGDVIARAPEIARIIERAKTGEMEPHEAVKAVWGLAAENVSLQSTLESALFDAFRIEPGSTDLARFPDRQRLVERWGFEEEDLVYTPFEDRPNYKMLHPLLMGMIVELLQFDGDVPELRTGRLPQGGSPAVPVRTTSRDPVVIGAMLRTASREVAAELAVAQGEHDAKVAKMIESVGGSGAPVTGLVRQETERGIAVPGYHPGHRAEMREVATPTGGDLARLSFAERQELAHKTLTSTQGRRSAAPVISEILLETLHADGYTAVHIGNGERVFASAEWCVMIDGGRTERNPNFNFVNTAARALLSKLRGELKGRANHFTHLLLRVTPVNEVSERRVGWRATLFEQGSTGPST